MTAVLTLAQCGGIISIGADNSIQAVAAPTLAASVKSEVYADFRPCDGSPQAARPGPVLNRLSAPVTREPAVRHFIDNHINFRRMFAEAIREDIRDNFDRSLIQPGHFLMRCGRDRPLVAARIYERDPDDGDSPAGEILGEPIDPVFVWTGRDRRPLQPLKGMTVEQTYAYLCADAAWARENSPDEPIARPYRKVDLTALPPVAPPPVEPKK